MQKVMPRGVRGFLVAERASNENRLSGKQLSDLQPYSEPMAKGEPHYRPKWVSEPPGSRKLGQV
jgi:hypothetical protein